MDQFGGNNDSGPVVEAYEMGVQEHGEEFMRERLEESAVRLPRTIFRTGLFDNPYLDVQETVATVGKPEFMSAGYEAQLSSLVLVKNQSVLPLKQGTTVYIPKRYVPETRNLFGRVTPARHEDAINLEIAGKFFTPTDDPNEADAGLVVITSPESGRGYKGSDTAAGGNGYLRSPCNTVRTRPRTSARKALPGVTRSNPSRTVRIAARALPHPT